MEVGVGSVRTRRVEDGTQGGSGSEAPTGVEGVGLTLHPHRLDEFLCP